MDDSIPQSIYSIKTYGDRPFRLVTQNKNGPCPILAIYNLLALRGTIKIPATSGLSAENMMQAIGEVVLTGSSNQSELIEGKVTHYSNKSLFSLRIYSLTARSKHSGSSRNLFFTSADDWS